MESLYLRGHTIQEVGGKVMIGSFMYGVAVIDGLLCSLRQLDFDFNRPHTNMYHL